MACSIKIVWMPILASIILVMLGVSGMELGIGVVLAASPTATASYIMAQQLHSDAELSGSIIMLSTLLSLITYSVALFMLRSFAW
jgi:predicted permease